METCETCRFGLYHEAREYRDSPGMIAVHAYVSCRRYPPDVGSGPFGGQPGRHKPFPQMEVGDWCGEYSPTPTKEME